MNSTLCKNRYNYTKRNKSPRPLALHQPSQNRTTTPTFRRASVCVCLVGFASLQSPWAHTLKASLPCLPLPLHLTSPSPQPLQKDNNPSPRTTFLPPLSKGGGLTARHKLLSCNVLLATHPPFLFTKLFCRQDGGIAAPPSFASHQPFQIRTIPRFAPTPLPFNECFASFAKCSKSPTTLPFNERSVCFASLRNFGRSTSGIHARPRKRVRFCCSVKPSQLWWGLFLVRTINEIFRTITLAFRRASVCVCLVGFASIAIVVVCGRCVTASSVICAVASCNGFV